MGFSSMAQCLNFLYRQNQLIVINEEVDPYLQMAAIHLRAFENGAGALYFSNIKGCKYPAASNLFGTLARAKLMFAETLPAVKQLVKMSANPLAALKSPLQALSAGTHAINALPLRVKQPQQC